MTVDDRQAFWTSQLFDPMVGWKSLIEAAAVEVPRARVTGRLQPEVSAAWLKQLKREEPWSLVGLAAWAAWLGSDGRQSDYVLHFSTESEDTELTPFRMRVQGDLILRSVRQMTRDRLLDALEHRPCEASWWPVKDPQEIPLAGMLFSERKKAPSATDQAAVPPPAKQLWLQVWQEGTDIHYALTGPETWPLQRWVSEWQVLLEKMLTEPMTVLQHLSLCLPEDRALLESFQPVAHPLSLDTTVVEMWQNRLADNADAVVLRHEGQDWSREDIEALARDWEVSAVFHGLEELEVVAILLPFGPQWLALHLAAWRRSLVVLTLNPKDPAAWIERILSRARVQMIFRSPGVVVTLQPMPPTTEVSLRTQKSRSTVARTPFGPTPTTAAIVTYHLADDGHVMLYVHTHHALSLSIIDQDQTKLSAPSVAYPPLGIDRLESYVWSRIRAGVVFDDKKESDAEEEELSSPWLAAETLGGCDLVPSQTEDGTYIVQLRAGIRGYIFNSKETLVPPGQHGLLWLGGERLFVDYLDDPPPHHVHLRHHAEFGKLLAMNLAASWSEDGVLSIYRYRDHYYCLSGRRLPLSVLASTLADHPAIDNVELVWRRSLQAKPELIYHSPRTLTVQPDSLRSFFASRLPEPFTQVTFTPAATTSARPEVAQTTSIEAADQPAEPVIPVHYLLLSALNWPTALVQSWQQMGLSVSCLTLDDLPDDELALEPYLHQRCSALGQTPTEIFALPSTGWWAIQIAQWFASSPELMPVVHLIDHDAPEMNHTNALWGPAEIQAWVQDWLARIGFASAKLREQMHARLSSDLSSLALTQLEHGLPFTPQLPSAARRAQARSYYYSSRPQPVDHGWQSYFATAPERRELPLPGIFLLSPLGRSVLHHLIRQSHVESRRTG